MATQGGDDLGGALKANPTWLVIHGDVYDAGEWVQRHPGGTEVRPAGTERATGPLVPPRLTSLRNRIQLWQRWLF